MATISFNAVAPFYDFLARLVFGNSITKAQTCFLDRIPPNASVLIVGGGTGWILEKVLQQENVRHIDYLEASSSMLDLSIKKYSRLSTDGQTVRFICGTEQDVPDTMQYDAIMTFFVLDVQPDTANLLTMMRTLHKHLKKKGIWLFADFKPNKQWHWALMKPMFWFFKLTCNLPHNRVPDYDTAFAHLQMNRKLSKTYYGQLIHSEVYEME